MGELFKPMLAVDYEEGELSFPYYGSAKIDGIRCVVINGEARTRTMKPLPNNYARAWFKKNAALLDGLDGELTIGAMHEPGLFQRTTSGLMSYGGMPAFTFNVFDVVDLTGKRPYKDRLAELTKRAKTFPKNVVLLQQIEIKDARTLKAFERVAVDAGYEGVMLRSVNSRYKQGRATVKENSLLKVKRFADSEAVIVGVEEQMHNGNMATKNEIGHTKRSSAKAGLKGKGTLGALIVKGVKGKVFDGVTFNIGTGFDDEMKQALWDKRGKLGGLIVKFKYLESGVKDKPRHPVFLGFRLD